MIYEETTGEGVSSDRARDVQAVRAPCCRLLAGVVDIAVAFVLRHGRSKIKVKPVACRVKLLRAKVPL